jgi:hypothetical protein
MYLLGEGVPQHYAESGETTVLLSIEAHRAASPTALSIVTSIRSARGTLT